MMNRLPPQPYVEPSPLMSGPPVTMPKWVSALFDRAWANAQQSEDGIGIAGIIFDKLPDEPPQEREESNADGL